MGNKVTFLLNSRFIYPLMRMEEMMPGAEYNGDEFIKKTGYLTE